MTGPGLKSPAADRCLSLDLAGMCRNTSCATDKQPARCSVEEGVG